MAEVKFHDIGEGMNEGEILNYFVKVGEKVDVDQPLIEMQTDKMVAEIPSPAAGIIKAIHFDVGETITVGTTIIEIDNGQKNTIPEGPEKTEKPAAAIAQQTEQNAPPTNSYKRILAAPYTRKIARDYGVDIENIQGTGPAGRITEEDIHQFVKKSSAGINHSTAIDDTPNQKMDQVADTIPFKGIRKQIANKMSHSLKTIPHVTHFDEADLTELFKLRKQLKKTGENISVVAFFIKSAAISLKAYPIFNAQLDEKNEVIRLAKDYHIGLATDTESGLMVPVLHHVSQKTLREIQTEMKGLTQKAQEGKLSMTDMKNGTFTISNVGPLGGTGATPIINHPETGIISFHKTKKMPVVMEDEEVAIRSIMNLSFSFDHRVADGATAVAFTNHFIELIENPGKLLLELV
jgi:pyruvate dehydrogenase E2 component (dihydrolipoamide acetyltransferase)